MNTNCDHRTEKSDHKLFDRGAFTIALNREVQVSEYAYGATGFTEWLLAYHGKPTRPPQSPHYLPKEAYLSWHMQLVFRGPARHLVGEDSSRRRGD
jgi:putative restriction endonuclease